jgi:hypothetical protein
MCAPKYTKLFTGQWGCNAAASKILLPQKHCLYISAVDSQLIYCSQNAEYRVAFPVPQSFSGNQAATVYFCKVPVSKGNSLTLPLNNEQY